MSNDTIRILYMEDEVGHATLLRRKMQRLGYQVELAFDGDEGLRKAAATDFDIIITDHNMPKSDGMQVIQRLRTELESDASIIMVTGAGSEHTAVEAMRLGADDYVVKDTEGGYLELLPAHIQKLIEKRALGLEKQLAQRALAAPRLVSKAGPVANASCGAVATRASRVAITSLGPKAAIRFATRKPST